MGGKKNKKTVPVYNHGEFFHGSRIQQNIHLYQISSLVACILIVKAVEDGVMKCHQSQSTPLTDIVKTQGKTQGEGKLGG